MPGLEYSKAEVVYAARGDGPLRRRRARPPHRARLLARDASADAAPEVARLIAPELSWTVAEQEASVGRVPRPRRGRAHERATSRDRARRGPRSLTPRRTSRSWSPDALHTRTREADPSDRPGRRGRGHRSVRSNPRRGVRRPPAPAARRVRRGLDRRRDAERVEPRLVAARDALGPRAGGAGARERGRRVPSTRTRSPRCCACARKPRCRSRSPRGAAVSAAPASRCTAESCSISAVSRASSTSTARRSSSTCARAPSATSSRTRCGTSTS